MDSYQQVIHQSRYSRWIESENRRETWEETVDRYMSTWSDILDQPTSERLRASIISMKVMPSMRAMWSAGPALKRNNIAGYNCSFLKIDSPRAFDEALYILMNGTGVGFSCEAVDVNKLPIVNDHYETTERTITIEDSKEGWAKALRKLIADLYLGVHHTWDFSKLRPAGSRLMTMGGRSSGPEPLKQLFQFVKETFINAAGRKLTPMECHDVMCKVGEIVVVGGVRRSALISLSDLGDEQIRHCKSGQWWQSTPHRALANNSAVYNGKPDMDTFLREWTSLVASKSGERGIYNRDGARRLAPERRKGELIDGTNPCAEIALRNNQYCNLTEVVARAEDDLESLMEKVELATILGTLQSTLTDFPYLRKVWAKNTEEERLLGVSLTGICDSGFLREADGEQLGKLRDHAVKVNKEWSERLGIPQSAAVTTVKPSGTVSQLVDASSGIHGRFSPYYIRTVRQSKDDPLTDFLIDQGIPHEDDVMNPGKTTVFSFPIKAPEGAWIAGEMNAIEQLEMWKKFKKYWAEHSVSVTVYVKENEWLGVGDWVYNNFDYITGVSFLPYSEHSYAQAPYQQITEEEYNGALQSMPEMLEWAQLQTFESEDTTEGAKTLACTGDKCELA